MTDTPDLQGNIESNDRLAEGLVRGVQEMGASQAKLPVHIDGETWDVTVQFRGAQPEPDERARLTKARHAFIQTTGRVDDAADMIRAEAFDAGWQARAVSSPAPSNNCPFCGKPMTPQGKGVSTCDNPDCGAPQYKRGVTGNEGKDGFRHTGGSDGVADGRRDRADGDSLNRRVGTGEVPPASSGSDVAVSAKTMIWGDPGMDELHKRLSTLSDRNAKKMLWGELVEARKKIIELQSPSPLASPAVVTPEQFKLCYIEDQRAFFTTQALADQWGDDWDDAPYEHNAETPYDPHSPRDFIDGKPKWAILELRFDGWFEAPCEGHRNSPWNVQQINQGATYWLKAGKDETIMAGASPEQFKEFIRRNGGKLWVPEAKVSELEAQLQQARKTKEGM